MAKVKFPETLIISCGGKDGNTNPFDAVGLKALNDLAKDMSKK